ncbi:MAG: hypothetical protein V3T83_05670 [Acidobacteriota bacterium]
MKARVTDKGVVIPPDILRGFEEVEIRREDDCIIVKPVGKRTPDPILGLGSSPVRCDAPDASANHDKYLAGSPR